MNRLLLTLFFLAIPYVNRPVQDPNLVCPVLKITCPEAVESGKTIRFKATVTGGKSKEISYNWTVDKGKIVFGQGTAAIEVDLAGEDCKNVTATVELGGTDPSCNRVGQCTACPQKPGGRNAR
jgi:hypothetical protein